MNQASGHCSGEGDDLSVVCRRVIPSDQSRVLSVLMTGWDRHRTGAAEEVLSTANGQPIDLDELWAAYDGSLPRAAILIVPNPGHTAMLFLSPVSYARQVSMTAALVEKACRAQDNQRIGLIQTLMDSQERLEVEALTRGGFEELAWLEYLQRPIGHRDELIDGNGGSGLAAMKQVTWSEANRAIFAEAILASYEQTLDCPRLVGLRGINDIITGHMTTGEFVPQLWVVAIDQGKPAAVMLINPIPRSRAVELVYLGIGVAWRGRGLGQRLLAQGFAMARRYGADEMVLAVDEANQPAVKLYRRLNFQSKTRKLALIFDLSSI